MSRKQLVAEALIDLHRRLSTLGTRSHERGKIMQETANLYGVSEQSLYRALAQRARPRALRRSDRGTPRILPQDKMEYYCELIAALKVRTSNKKGRHLSTGEAIRLIEEFGVETPEGLIKAQKSMFKITTINRYLRQWGYDHQTLRRQPAAVRFQAECSNDCWQFDLSPSDLKEIKEPLWLQPSKGAPTLMLFSVVDDRSGVAYQEYRCVYGEDVSYAIDTFGIQNSHNLFSARNKVKVIFKNARRRMTPLSTVRRPLKYVRMPRPFGCGSLPHSSVNSRNKARWRLGPPLSAVVLPLPALCEMLSYGDLALIADNISQRVPI